MSQKCGLRYCGATVANYNEMIKVIKCPCVQCLGENCDECSMFKILVTYGIDAQKTKCMKCKFYNGR